MEMEQLNFGDELPCSNNVENTVCWPDVITVNAPMLILSLAMENDWDDWDEEVVIVGFIIALFLTHISSITGAFIGFTKDIKHVTDDVSSIDDDMNDVSLDNTFTDSTLAVGKGSGTVAPSAGTTAKSDEPGKIQLLLAWCGCFRMHYYM